MNKRVKIVATLGPAVEIRGGKKFGDDGYWGEKLDVEASAQKIAELIKEGANVFRFNFSHGDHEEQGERMKVVRRAEEIANQKVGFLLDTKGPEIRTELFEDDAKEYEYKTGDKLRVATKQGMKSTKDVIALNVAGGLDIFDNVEIGQTILIDDGKLGLTLAGKDAATREFEVEVQNDGVIAKQKGVNIPNTKIPFPALAERDNADIRFGLEQGLNFIAISFVRSAKDVNEVRAILEETGNTHVQLFPKIENQQGIDNIDEIIAASEGIMIARGDMGVEIPFEQIPAIQKELIHKAYNAGKQVITATQMLESMMTNPRPTRAEITDVANAIYDGTSAIMLSGETAAGKYPIDTVKTMSLIARTTEEDINYISRFSKRDTDTNTDITNAISHATVTTAHDLNANAIITVTKTGTTARMISKYRPNCPIIGCTTDETILRQLNMSWGIIPVLVEEKTNTDVLFSHAVEAAVKKGLIKFNDLVVITAGVPLGMSGTTNLLKVAHVGTEV